MWNVLSKESSYIRCSKNMLLSKNEVNTLIYVIVFSIWKKNKVLNEYPFFPTTKVYDNFKKLKQLGRIITKINL